MNKNAVDRVRKEVSNLPFSDRKKFYLYRTYKDFNQIVSKHPENVKHIDIAKWRFYLKQVKNLKISTAKFTQSDSYLKFSKNEDALLKDLNHLIRLKQNLNTIYKLKSIIPLN